MSALAKFLQKHLVGAQAVEALAKTIGAHPSTVYNWRAGRRDLSTDDLIAVAHYFKTTTDTVLGLTHEPLNTQALTESLHESLNALKETGFQARNLSLYLEAATKPIEKTIEALPPAPPRKRKHVKE